MDASWLAHWPKLPMWLGFEGVLLALTVHLQAWLAGGRLALLAGWLARLIVCLLAYWRKAGERESGKSGAD